MRDCPTRTHPFILIVSESSEPKAAIRLTDLISSYHFSSYPPPRIISLTCILLSGITWETWMYVCLKPAFQLLCRVVSNLLRKQILNVLESHCFQKQGIFSILNEEYDSRIVNICEYLYFLYVQRVNYIKPEPVEMLEQVL